MKQRPIALKKGDLIGIIAPSSPPKKAQLQASLAFLDKLGLRYVFGGAVNEVNGYLAGSDEERLADLHTMFADPAIKGIICACGGYGAARFTDAIDFELLAKNPKILWGYSDITFLHNAIGNNSNLVTFHGPMLASDVAEESFQSSSALQFQQLFEPTILQYDLNFGPIKTRVGGQVTAEVVGGNLSLIANGIGTPFQLDVAGKILLIEDVGEEPYRVDCMLNQLRQAGMLDQLTGVIIGDFSEAQPKKQQETLELDDVFSHYFSPLHIPVVSEVKIGHCQPHFAIPLGVEATIDADEPKITFQAGVRKGD
ncbi:S66 peptidase family protein [Kurthia sibirica]|uniref:LD-carboxypeptidase n=1 Tax=Kurthia sibirica TaxID=202750 RepID=A0A2U3AH75_9BACL|nr:LD-carboxypeptidase [Kurthia sibirica]PWI23903.1 LD-carboxypeptidase [Kurthia sibirica]GEK34911.1 putative murein peptide carboxypeptidase [Kurthia sibirica]